MTEEPKNGRRILATLEPEATKLWLFPGEIPGVRALLGWTIDSRVDEDGAPQPVMDILTRALCRRAMLTFYRQGGRRLGRGRKRRLKPSTFRDVIRAEPTCYLLTTDHPEQALDLFDNGWLQEAQRVFLTPPGVFPALEYRQIAEIFEWSPYPRWIDRFPLPRRIGASPLAAAEHLVGTNVCGLLLPHMDGEFAELILFEATHWPPFERALADECATAGVDFRMVDGPTFGQTKRYVSGGFWVGEDGFWVRDELLVADSELEKEQPMGEVRIPYKPNRLISILIVAAFGACAGIMGNVALTNDRGLILSRVFEFSTREATLFYWVITSIAVLFILVWVLVLVKSMLSKREIIITDAFITSPRSGVSKTDVTVKYSDITAITLQTIQKTKLLHIDHLGGRLSIPNTMLPDKQAFEQLVSQLQTKLNDYTDTRKARSTRKCS